jgi:hypothetical protein
MVKIMTTFDPRQALDALSKKAGGKSDYVPKTLDEARENFIQRAEQSILELREGQVRPYHPAPMVKQQKKAKTFCVKIGYGNNNAYLANAVHSASQVLRYKTAEEAAVDIETFIIPSAEAGTFDESLSASLEKHRALAMRRRATIVANRQAANDAEDEGSISALEAA